MADYVSILKRTLDGLGSGATPALRERVYGRARDAVRRQLDGMVPPPADDVKARQLEQLEAAVAEVEAGYAASEAVDGAADGADGARDDAGAGEASEAAASEASENDVPEGDVPASDVPAGEAPPPDAGGETGGAARDASPGPSAAASGSFAAAPATPSADAMPAGSATTAPPSPDRSAPAPFRDEPAAPESAAPEPPAFGPEPPASGATRPSDPISSPGAGPGDRASPPATPTQSPERPGASAAPVGGVSTFPGGPRSALAPTPPMPPPLPPVDDLPPSDAYRVPPGRSDGSDRDADRGPEVLDADGPVGGRLPDEGLPSVAMIGPNGDAVLDPAEAVPLGASGVAASFDRPDVGAPSAMAPEDGMEGTPRGAAETGATDDDPTDDDLTGVDTMGVETGADDAAADGPPARTLADGVMARGAPLTPDTLSPQPLAPEPLMPEPLMPEPLMPEPLAPEPVAPDPLVAKPSVADPLVGGATSALAFANRGRPDLPGTMRVPAGPDIRPLPPVDDQDEPGISARDDAAVAMPRADGPIDAFDASPEAPAPSASGITAPTTRPYDDEPIAIDPVRTSSPAVSPAARRADGPPDVAVPAEPERGGRGGLWAALAVLLLVLGALLFARGPLADATGVEGFRTAFGLGPAFDRTVGSLLGGGETDDPVEIAEPATIDPAPGGPAIIEPSTDPVATDPAPPAGDTAGDTAVAGAGQKVPDRLPTGDAPVDVTPGEGDVTVRPVPVETVSPDAAPAEGAEDVAVLRPDDPAAAPVAPAGPPEGAGRAFLVGEPVAGVSDRADGSVSWSVASESPGRDLPPEPAIRGDVTLGDGTAVEVTVRRNADESLPASHLIEIVFALPDGGRTVNRLPLVGFKDSLQVPARPLVAVPAKITDDFFVVGLNSLASAVESNLALMGSEQFMDVQLIDGNDRRATLTLEKGADGTSVFGEVLDAWNDSPLPG